MMSEYPTLDALQANLDRINTWGQRTMKYFDEAPDGSTKKANALKILDEVSRQRLAAEKAIDDEMNRLGL